METAPFRNVHGESKEMAFSKVAASFWRHELFVLEAVLVRSFGNAISSKMLAGRLYSQDDSSPNERSWNIDES